VNIESPPHSLMAPAAQHVEPAGVNRPLQR
jgi:hypothetical protein